MHRRTEPSGQPAVIWPERRLKILIWHVHGSYLAGLSALDHDWYRPEWMAVIAVGDVDPDKMERLIRENFSDLPKRTSAKEVPRFDVPPHEQTLFSIVSDKEATSSSVALLVKRPRRPANSSRRRRSLGRRVCHNTFWRTSSPTSDAPAYW